MVKAARDGVVVLFGSGGDVKGKGVSGGGGGDGVKYGRSTETGCLEVWDDD